MRAWGVLRPCGFCGERDESRDHLFFACPYTFTIWSELTKRLLQRKLNPDWSRTLASLRSTQFNLTDKTLLRMLFQTTLYMIWRERNSRSHNQGFNTSSALIKLIDKAIGDRIASLRLPPTSNICDLQLRWEELRRC